MNKFKNNSGTFYTKAIFYETAEGERENVLYTLKDEDYLEYPSLRLLYLETDDPTEVRFYENHLGGFNHWNKLLACTWFSQWLENVRDEYKAQQFSKYIAQIKKKAEAGDLKANQYLVEQPWLKKTVGRPSTAKIKEEAQRLKDFDSLILQDLERISL